MNLNILIALYDSLSKDNIKKLAYKFSENPYGYRSGWPDIVVEKQKEIYFIEVKTKDKLHESQLYTIPVMKEILPFAFMVYRIKK
ncbi:VRR-NUC domain-containing protein [Acinetobacter sp. ASP199]|uniref:VRR-NUC domain-containing protein n=1 Tax=unclassified Acinetobacter TaxID=196816 RepID=UPI001F604FD1|nr:VRR-NUC domain-containing protein [Acinetobacter sp. ASP199]UNT59240.1 VRR-NUC domain-containing protein [Acinetobacter sp. ASP199]